MNKKEIENFYQYCAYGSYILKDGTKVPFNRRYEPLEDNDWWVENTVTNEYYYNDGTDWHTRIKHSGSRIPI
jgi:hypothetical protein